MVKKKLTKVKSLNKYLIKMNDGAGAIISFRILAPTMAKAKLKLYKKQDISKKDGDFLFKSIKKIK